MKLKLLVLRCINIERTKEFYEQLGLIFENEKHENGPSHFSSEFDGFVLELYPAAGNQIDNSRLGIEIENLSSIIESMEIIEEYEFNSRKTWLAKDPDGRKIELYEKKP